jgi:ATPase subunit of ABC transporter with duplicated ATPase domains
VITATDLEVRAGSAMLLQSASFRIGPGDRIGLVGRNGAGKTTLTRILAGEAAPAAGSVTRSTPVAYLPQDPGAADPVVSVRDRILSARGLDVAVHRMRQAERAMADDPQAMRRYTNAESEFLAAGGYRAEAEAATLAAGLGIAEALFDRELGTLSGGQRRRVELARILFSGAPTLLLDEPTNHLDADSINWLRQHLRSHTGGLAVISHDAALLDAVVNKVFHLDAVRSELDVYNLGWTAYLRQRETDERRRRRERSNAERQATVLKQQADRMRAKATKATAAKNMARRADRLLDTTSEARAADRVARIALPDPAPCGKVPLTATGLSKSYGSAEVFTDVDLAVDRGARIVVLGLNGAGKTTLLRMLTGLEPADTGVVSPGHGLRLGYYAQEHETLDRTRTALENMLSAAPELTELQARSVLGSFLFTGDDVHKPAGVLAALVVSAANVLLLDEPTNNLDPASREEILRALGEYRGAVVLVTHDEGAVQALAPERVVILPDGVEDLWTEEYADLISLA